MSNNSPRNRYSMKKYKFREPMQTRTRGAQSSNRMRLARLAFGVGTAPVLLGVAGQAVSRALHSGLTYVTPAVLALNALILTALAWNGQAG
jgi:sulfite exporter TauE/SafE